MDQQRIRRDSSVAAPAVAWLRSQREFVLCQEAPMVVLRHFVASDIPILQKYCYQDLKDQEIQEMMVQWDRKEYEGKYFELFAVTAGQAVVGSISLYEHTKSIVSLGPEIFVEYRRRGYASAALREALQIAKNRGYQIVRDRVRTNNTASIALHEKLGFETDGHEYENQKGDSVFLFIKLLR